MSDEMRAHKDIAVVSNTRSFKGDDNTAEGIRMWPLQLSSHASVRSCLQVCSWTDSMAWFLKEKKNNRYLGRDTPDGKLILSGCTDTDSLDMC